MTLEDQLTEARVGLNASTIAALKEAPGLKPPLGHVPNYIDPESLWAVAQLVQIATLVMMVFLVTIRLYTRKFIIKEVWWDDFFIALTLLLYVGFEVTGYYLLAAGGGVHQYDQHVINIIEVLYMAMVAKTLYILEIWTIKMAILLQIQRIFAPHRRGFLFIMVWVMVILNTGFYIAEFVLDIWECSPRPRTWNRLIPGTCVGRPSVAVTGIFNVLSDILIFILPIHSIWKLQMPNKRKIGLTAIFSVGIFAIASSALRFYYSVVVLINNDLTWYIEIVGFFFCAEVWAGVVVACAPTLPKWYNHIRGRSEVTGAGRLTSSNKVSV